MPVSVRRLAAILDCGVLWASLMIWKGAFGVWVAVVKRRMRAVLCRAAVSVSVTATCAADRVFSSRAETFLWAYMVFFRCAATWTQPLYFTPVRLFDVPRSMRATPIGTLLTVADPLGIRLASDGILIWRYYGLQSASFIAQKATRHQRLCRPRFDGAVERTKPPVRTGQGQEKSAAAGFAFLCLGCRIVPDSLNHLTGWWACLLFLALTYPFTKRFLRFPNSISLAFPFWYPDGVCRRCWKRAA